MNKLWYICLLVRLSLIFLIRRNVKRYNRFFHIILLSIGLGFYYKGYTGSNNEIQLSKVFWHETRYLHGTLYLLSSFYLFKQNLDMSSIILLIDLLFSILYRIEIFS